MINLEIFEPYNDTSCIDRLIEAAKKDKFYFSKQIQVDIMIRIRKLKVQLYFKKCVESYEKEFQNQCKVEILPDKKALDVYNTKRNEYLKTKKSKKGALSSLKEEKKLITKMDVDNFLHDISGKKKDVLRKKMEYVKHINPHDKELKKYFIKKMVELIRCAEDKELIENAKNAKSLRKESEHNFSDGKSHRPYLVFYPTGGQNKKY